MSQLNFAERFNYHQLFIRYFLWIFCAHFVIFLITIYGIPNFNFKKRPDLTIELSTLAPSAGGQQQNIQSQSRTSQKTETPKTLPKDKEGTQTAQASASNPTPAPSSASGPANAQTADADYKAAYLNNPKPPYPPLAVRMRLEGKVTLLAEVLPDGKAGRVAIETSSGHEMLDQSALQTVKQWQFSPARKDGVIITQVVRIPITFNLKSR
ncbi:energy transducer TonB [Polynucleobacter sp. MWH-Loch1C5]|uniref:energy transducer TonB n=1 Tax=Polynucleobacter sp. MWH-Loch1C5 TaxID=2689108 RepID=UPI001C0DF8A3|nr:energy transducer TonB [Polynucleobacter sp. MWH-Loch1C5]MBU3543285.1 energy transducer TonB [Polynucleobacter sp. MWH-Loch1C5]